MSLSDGTEVLREASSLPGSEAGSSESENFVHVFPGGSTDDEVVTYLAKNPRIIHKFFAEGNDRFGKLMQCYPNRVVQFLTTKPDLLADSFEKHPDAINQILDEEASILHNFLQSNQDALNHYLRVKPQALASYFEKHAEEFNRLFYTDPALLSAFCDDHPSFMAAWLKHRPATVQKYLDDNPALFWNHVRAHPSYRSGGQAWDRQFTMALLIEIPENQERLVREPIQWTLPKDPERRKAKLIEMAARGENQVAVRGVAAGKQFIDEDIIIEENDIFKLSEKERKFLDAEVNCKRPARLKWYQGRNIHINSKNIVRQELMVESPETELPKPGPYQRAKGKIFQEIQPSLHIDVEDEEETESEEDGEQQDEEELNTEEETSSDSEHNTERDDTPDSDDEPPQTPPPQSSSSESEFEPPKSAINRKMSATDSDVPLSARRGRKGPAKNTNAHSNNLVTEYQDETDLQGDRSPDRQSAQEESPVEYHGHRGYKRLPGESKPEHFYDGDNDTDLEFDNDSDESSDVESDFAIDELETKSKSNSQSRASSSVPARALVEYPAPARLLTASQKLPSGTKWRLFEEDLAIGHMLDIRDEAQISGEDRFRETARRLQNIDDITRTWTAVKNFWNRTGRARSGFDERKNKNAPLATSQQGKGAQIQRTRPQASHNGRSTASNTSTPTFRRASTSSRSSTSQNRKATKTLPSPVGTPKMAMKRLPKNTFDRTTASSALEDLQQAYSDLSKQWEKKLKAEAEQFSAQMVSQMRALKETLATASSGSEHSPVNRYLAKKASPKSVSAGHKRTIEEIDDTVDDEQTVQRTYKRKRPSPLNLGEISNLKSQKAESFQQSENKTIEHWQNDPSNRAFQAGIRDRSKMRAPKYR